MDSNRFDRFTRMFSRITSRRTVTKGLATAGVGSLLTLRGERALPFDPAVVQAKKKRLGVIKKCSGKLPCPVPDNVCKEAACEKQKGRKGRSKRACVTISKANGTECGPNKTCADSVCTDVCGSGPACVGGRVCDSGTCICPAGKSCTVKVSPASLNQWFGYNDESDVIDNALLDFVTGPGSPPHGDGSVKMTVTGTQRRNIATYQFASILLADITELGFSTFNPSAGNGGSANSSGYLHFNVSFDGSTNFQRRLVFVPKNNGNVKQDKWQRWDAIRNGAAQWNYSGSTWPIGTVLGTVPGSTLKTWDQILTEYPGVKIKATDAFLGIRIGEPYPAGFTGHVGSVTFGTTTTTIFAFGPDA